MCSIYVLALSAGSALASNSITDGNWEYTEPLLSVGDQKLDKALVFPIYHSSTASYETILGEVEEVSDMAGSEFSTMDDQLELAFKDIQASYLEDLGFLSSGGDLYLRTSDYISSRMDDGIIMYSLRLNDVVVHKAFTHFDSFGKFVSTTIPLEYYSPPEDRYPPGEDARTITRMTENDAERFIEIFKTNFGLDITSMDFSVLYERTDRQVFVYKCSNLKSCTFYGINMSDGSSLKPFTIESFKF
jgi:hypothetical protein